MCIVIDTNTFASVFEVNSQKYKEFYPVLEWIVYGNGKIVYGGTKYMQELRKAFKYLKFFVELSKVSKVVELDKQKVDEKQKEISTLVNHRDFNDQHLIAIIIVSGCKLICSDDSRAYRFIKIKSLYPKHIQCPMIYRGASNKDLLCNKNIVDICTPIKRLHKTDIENLMS
jgi:predicted nucleic acid-binding protein